MRTHTSVAAMLRVVLQRFSEAPEIFTDLVHLHEPAAEGATVRPEESEEDPLAKVLRVV